MTDQRVSKPDSFRELWREMRKDEPAWLVASWWVTWIGLPLLTLIAGLVWLVWTP